MKDDHFWLKEIAARIFDEICDLRVTPELLGGRLRILTMYEAVTILLFRCVTGSDVVRVVNNFLYSILIYLS